MRSDVRGDELFFISSPPIPPVSRECSRQGVQPALLPRRIQNRFLKTGMYELDTAHFLGSTSDVRELCIDWLIFEGVC